VSLWIIFAAVLRIWCSTNLFVFFRRTRSNPCDFDEFLQALQSSETIRDVTCSSQLHLGISEDEWVLQVTTLGSIRDIQNLSFYCAPGSRDFHPFQAIADTVNNAHSLRKLMIVRGGNAFPRDPSGLIALANALRKLMIVRGDNAFPRYPSGLIAFANALREHTSLQEFFLFDLRSYRKAAPQDYFLDPVLRALPACPHLRKATITTECASTDAVKNLLHLPEAADLRLILKTEQWLAVADEIR
jgi:hypothetical protein